MLYTYKQMLLKNKELKDKLVQVAAEETLSFKCCGSWYSDKFRMLVFAYVKRTDVGYKLLVTDGLYKQTIDIHSLNILDFLEQPIKTDIQLLFNKEDFAYRITEGYQNDTRV